MGVDTGTPRTIRRGPPPTSGRRPATPSRTSTTPTSSGSGGDHWRVYLRLFVAGILLLIFWERVVRSRLPRESHMDDPQRRHGPPSCDVDNIPHQIFMTSNNTDPFFKQSLMKANPGWNVRVVGDDATEAYVADNCPWVLGAYLCLVPKAYQADVFRACALYTEGGVYLDDDILPFHPLTEYYDDCDNVTLVNGHRDYMPWTGDTMIRAKRIELNFVIAKRQHPMFACIMETINDRVRTRSYGVSTTDVTGPIVAHRCYAKHPEATNVAMVFGGGGRFYWAGQPGTSPIAFQRTGDNKSDSHYSRLYKHRKVFAC